MNICCTYHDDSTFRPTKLDCLINWPAIFGGGGNNDGICASAAAAGMMGGAG
jgi:hypothetical protein